MLHAWNVGDYVVGGLVSPHVSKRVRLPLLIMYSFVPNFTQLRIPLTILDDAQRVSDLLSSLLAPVVYIRVRHQQGTGRP